MSVQHEKEKTMGLRNAFDKMIIAREKQARRYVAGALLNMDDETLKRAGLNRAALRSQGPSNYPF